MNLFIKKTYLIFTKMLYISKQAYYTKKKKNMQVLWITFFILNGKIHRCFVEKQMKVLKIQAFNNVEKDVDKFCE